MDSGRGWSRRRVIGAGAGVGLFHIVPASAQGKDGRPAPSNRITMAAIGTGGMGNGNLGSFLGQPEVQMLAVCDVDRTRGGKAKETVDKRYGTSDCKAYVDFRDVIARGDVDAFVQSLPDHWHAMVGIEASRAGIDTYGEKPFAHSVVDGRALVEAVERYGRIWQTGSWQRSRREFRTAAELVRNGRLGKVVKIEIGLPGGIACKPVTFGDPPPELDYDLWCGPGPLLPYCRERVHYNWRFQLSFGGGKLMDWVPHHGDIAHWAMDWDNSGPVEVWGQGDYPTAGIYDAPTRYHVYCRYANGTEMHVSNENKGGVKFIGANGQWIHANRGSLLASPESLLRDLPGPHEIKLYYSDNHQRNFLECIKTRQQTITPAETAHRSASIGHLGNIAMRLGRKLRWKPDTEEFVDDPSANALLGRALRPPWHL
jgi:predicted dehydrogenase